MDGWMDRTSVDLAVGERDVRQRVAGKHPRKLAAQLLRIKEDQGVQFLESAAAAKGIREGGTGRPALRGQFTFCELHATWTSHQRNDDTYHVRPIDDANASIGIAKNARPAAIIIAEIVGDPRVAGGVELTRLGMHKNTL